MIYPGEFRTLTETHSIQDEKLKDHDVLLFIRRRSVVLHDVVVDTELKSPTLDDIIRATSNLTPANTVQREPSATQPVNPFDSWAEADVCQRIFHLYLYLMFLYVSHFNVQIQ